MSCVRSEMIEHRERTAPLFPQAAVVCSTMVLPVVQVADLTLLHTSEGEPGVLRKRLVAVQGGSVWADLCCVAVPCPSGGRGAAAEHTVPSTLLHSAQRPCQETE